MDDTATTDVAGDDEPGMAFDANPAEAGGTSRHHTAKANAFELRGIRASYGRIEVLHGIDLEVGEGDVLALLGPNGAGKTTLLKVAGGRIRPTHGTVLLGGTDVTGKNPAGLCRLGLCSLPEGRGVFPNLTVAENLLMWTYARHLKRSDVEERAFGRFPRLAERRNQKAGTLSGGEQQMLAFARALVSEPRVLLLDEMSMGLAPLVVEGLYEVVREVAAAGTTVILAEQFVEMALGVATRAALIAQGHLVLSGEPEEVAGAAADTYLGSLAHRAS